MARTEKPGLIHLDTHIFERSQVQDGEFPRHIAGDQDVKHPIDIFGHAQAVFALLPAAGGI